MKIDMSKSETRRSKTYCGIRLPVKKFAVYCPNCLDLFMLHITSSELWFMKHRPEFSQGDFEPQKCPVCNQAIDADQVLREAGIL